MNDNKLIAEFMGAHEVKHERGWTYYKLPSNEILNHHRYHTSWDHLMPEVEKIECLGYWVNRNDGDVTISNKSDIVLITPMSSGGIDMMYKAVVEFIKQHK